MSLNGDAVRYNVVCDGGVLVCDVVSPHAHRILHGIEARRHDLLPNTTPHETRHGRHNRWGCSMATTWHTISWEWRFWVWCHSAMVGGAAPIPKHAPRSTHHWVRRDE